MKFRGWLKRTKAFKRGCLRKRRHHGYKEAMKHLRSLEEGDDSRLNVYKCRFCGFWHVGHLPPGDSR